MSMAEYFADLRRRIEAGELRDPNGSQEPPRSVSTDCICRGHGWLTTYRTDGVPDGMVACVCTKKATRERHRERCIAECRVDEATAARLTFESWARGLNEGCTPAFNATVSFSDALAGRRWLYLRGISGLGKTHLAVAAVYRMAQRGVAAQYWRIQDLVSALHEAVGASVLAQFSQELSALPMLAIDDYGAGYMKEFGALEIENILDARYSHRRPTLITTNQTLADFSPRLRSRLMDPSVVDLVELSGEDVRPRLERSQ